MRNSDSARVPLWNLISFIRFESGCRRAQKLVPISVLMELSSNQLGGNVPQRPATPFFTAFDDHLSGCRESVNTFSNEILCTK